MTHVGRPATGIAHYLRDIVFGANDGIITTLAVVAAVAGGALGSRVAVILGLANLVADGLSMGAGNYLSLKSELEQEDRPVGPEHPARHGLATFVAFAVAGAIPLAAFVVPSHRWTFAVAVGLSLAALFVVGAARAPFTRRPVAWSGLEMLVIGGAAAIAAYLMGEFVHAFV